MIMELKAKWVGHLKENTMTYGDHFKFATGHGVRCIKAGILLIIHGILPCFFRRAGSKLINRLNAEFNQHMLEIQSMKTD